MWIRIVVVLLFAPFAVVGCSGDRPPPDPSALARAAHADALATGIDYEMVDGSGSVVASMKGNLFTMAGVTGTVSPDGDHVTFDGVTIDLPGARGDPEISLKPLLRQAHHEGNTLVLDGDPPARAWLTTDGKLDRLEVDLSDGYRLVVTRRLR